MQEFRDRRTALGPDGNVAQGEYDQAEYLAMLIPVKNMLKILDYLLEHFNAGDQGPRGSKMFDRFAGGR